MVGVYKYTLHNKPHLVLSLFMVEYCHKSTLKSVLTCEFLRFAPGKYSNTNSTWHLVICSFGPSSGVLAHKVTCSLHRRDVISEVYQTKAVILSQNEYPKRRSGVFPADCGAENRTLSLICGMTFSWQGQSHVIVDILFLDLRS